MVQVRSAEIGSAEASISTIRQRSKFYERLETICCARKDSAEPKQDVFQQRSSLIKRNKEGYFKAAKIAGLAIFNKFKLDPETALSLKKEMPLNLWKTVKRTLNDSFGVDLMGTERQLGEGVRKHGEFEYEVGEFINSSGETVTFLRVTDFETLYKTSVEEMNSGLLSKDTSNTSLLVCGDKGGSSTKILCQFTSSEKSQPVRTAKLLGIYQGSKESREIIECAFGPIFEQLNNLHEVPPSDSSSSQAIRGQHETGPNLRNEENLEPEQFFLKLANENKTVRKLAELLPGCYNENNGIFSAECEHCINHFRKHSWTGADNVHGDTTNI